MTDARMQRSPGDGPIHAFMEHLLSILYLGDWPARAWGLLPASRRVDAHTLRLPVLPAGARPLRLAFLSDLHIGPTTSRHTLGRARDLVHDHGVEVLLLGGDYVFLEATPARLDRLDDFVRSLDVPRVLGVLGNHDRWTHRDRIEGRLTACGVRVLCNERLHLEEHGLVIDGLDDPWTGTPEVPSGDSPARIVLCHSPDGLATPGLGAFDLYLCGHTHGGMIASPWGPLVLPRGDLCRSYPHGVGDHDLGPIVVSRGIGGVEVPVRLFAPPDVWIIDLEPGSG
jgi:predicted MPP superfamily phosphohydrolase